MSNNFGKRWCAAAVVVILGSLRNPMYGQSNLQVALSNGVQTLSYQGVTLEDRSAHGGDGFYIGHMKMTDLSGALLGGGQYTWGENNQGEFWNSADSSWTYFYSWGSIYVRFVPNGDSLDMKVVTQNNAGSGVIFDGAVIYPFVIRFPQLPVGFGDPSYEHLAFNTTGPSVTLADYGASEVAAVDTDASKPLYTGFEPAGDANAYYPIIASTALDNMATFFPRNDRPVGPGETDSYTVSLRFAPSGTSASLLAADAYQAWAQTWPAQLNWPDRRIIGTAYLASAGPGSNQFAAGFPSNPRRYFNDGNADDFDMRTADGLGKFQNRILQQANSNVSNLQKLNAQGLITWDIEGQEYPHDTSYVCSPDQIATVAPEMESVIGDPGSPYNGMKLDDAYFKIIRDAGFRVGVCVRPQQFTLYGGGQASQVFLPNSQIVDQLTGKMKYAHDRWGATLFYVDSSVDVNGGALDPAIFQQVAANLPDSLVMPEETTPKDYAYTAPFQSFIFHTDLGTPAETYSYYPKAFSVNLVNDADPGKLAQYRNQLTDSIRHGDILMVHADYWQDNNPTVVQMYLDAGGQAGGPVAPPVISPVTAPVSSPAPPVTPPPPAPDPTPSPDPSAPIALLGVSDGQTISGVVTISAQVLAPLDSAGTHLQVDGAPAPNQIVTQNPYRYTVDTSLLGNGRHVLQGWAHTIGNETLMSAPIIVVVSN